MSSIQDQRTNGQLIKRGKTIAPAVNPPTDDQLVRFSSHDRALLHMLFQEPVEYVDHELFRKNDVETRLFSGPARLNGQSTVFEGDRFVSDASLAAEDGALSTAQEVHLFQQYNYARKRVSELMDHAKVAGLSHDQLRELTAWARRALEARGQLATSNLPLVLAMAKRTRLHSLDFNELISEGNFALLRSIDKFDCSRGFKFSTYACRAILKAFSRVAMRTSRYRSQFPAEFDPTLEKSDYVDRKRDGTETDCVDEIREILSKNRADLKDIERTVIRERFALDAPHLPARPKTLEEVGAMIGVTKERVRQIQNKALQKIRHVLQGSLAN